jgi:hypothetical protein
VPSLACYEEKSLKIHQATRFETHMGEVLGTWSLKWNLVLLGAVLEAVLGLIAEN